jgi:hypothetical protein
MGVTGLVPETIPGVCSNKHRRAGQDPFLGLKAAAIARIGRVVQKLCHGYDTAIATCMQRICVEIKDSRVLSLSRAPVNGCQAGGCMLWCAMAPSRRCGAAAKME